jgi:hypothetical protein
VAGLISPAGQLDFSGFGSDLQTAPLRRATGTHAQRANTPVQYDFVVGVVVRFVSGSGLVPTLQRRTDGGSVVRMQHQRYVDNIVVAVHEIARLVGCGSDPAIDRVTVPAYR